MSHGRYKVAVVLCLALCFVVFSSPSLALPPQPTDELKFLLSAWEPFTGSGTWNESSDCENWVGLRCDEFFNVVAIDLPGAGIAGNIPDRGLNNNLIGTLTYLDLSNNNITQGLPPAFSSMMKLRTLLLKNNEMTGSISSLVPGPFVVDPTLLVIDISNNQFTGAVPEGLTRFTSLTTINLSGNQLSGSLPDLIFDNLTSFDASSNLLTGTIPQVLALGASLESVDLSNNLLSGRFPSAFTRAPNLFDINFSNNFLSGRLPIIQLKTNDVTKKSLTKVDLSRNFFFGRVPLDLGQLPICPTSARSRFLQLKLGLNCLSPTIRCPLRKRQGQGQRKTDVCNKFCNTKTRFGQCNYRGYCEVSDDSTYEEFAPKCVCDQGWYSSEANPYTCI